MFFPFGYGTDKMNLAVRLLGDVSYRGIRDSALPFLGQANQPAVISEDIPATEFVPPMKFFYRGNDAIVCIAGITGRVQGQKFADLQGDPRAPTPNYGLSRALVSLIEQLVSDGVFNNFFHATGQVTIIGHSYGAYLGHALAAALKVSQAARRVELFTFGAPRVATYDVKPAWSDIPTVRVLRDDDVIGKMVPWSSESATLAFLVGGPTFEGNRWGHTTQASIFNDGGFVREGWNSSAQVGGFGGGIGAWWTEYYRGDTSTHSWDAYMNSLRRYPWSPTVAENPVGPVRDNSATRPAPPTIPEAREQFEAANDKASKDFRRESLRPGNFPVPAPFTVEKDQFGFKVLCEKQFFARFPSGTKARKCASKGNSLLRAMQRSSDFDPLSAVDAMREAFFSLSEDVDRYAPNPPNSLAAPD